VLPVAIISALLLAFCYSVTWQILELILLTAGNNIRNSKKYILKPFFSTLGGDGLPSIILIGLCDAYQDGRYLVEQMIKNRIRLVFVFLFPRLLP
jgi:hypothetical protein